MIALLNSKVYFLHSFIWWDYTYKFVHWRTCSTHSRKDLCSRCRTATHTTKRNPPKCYLYYFSNLIWSIPTDYLTSNMAFNLSRYKTVGCNSRCRLAAAGILCLSNWFLLSTHPEENKSGRRSTWRMSNISLN